MTARFGLFEFSPASGDLRREGIPVRLQPQPAKALALLIAREGGVVSREELQREVWGAGTHVDFERGLNFCIAQIRTALGDSADAPRYIETVPKQGYRFIAPVRREVPIPEPAQREAPTDAPVVSAHPKTRAKIFAAAAAAAAVLLAGLYGLSAIGSRPTIIVIPFYNETGQPLHAATAASLGDAVVARLADRSRSRALSVVGNAPALRNPFAREDVQGIAQRLDGQYLVIGQLKSDGAGLRLVAHFIRVTDMKHLWASTFDAAGFDFQTQTRVAEEVATSISGSLTSRP